MKRLESDSGIPVLMTVKDLADCLRVSVRTIWRWRHDPAFPRPLTIGGRSTRWRVAYRFAAIQPRQLSCPNRQS